AEGRSSEVARGGVEPPTFRFSVGRSYQLSYLAGLGSCYTSAGWPSDAVRALAYAKRRAVGAAFGAGGPDGTWTPDLPLDRAARPPTAPQDLAGDAVPPTGFEPVLPP